MSKIQFGAKVEPARNNPYALAQQPAACGTCGGCGWIDEGHEQDDGRIVAAPGDCPECAQQPAASAPERVDRATLRQALHAMKRCQRESGGSRWAPWIAKVEAALDAGDDRD